MKTLLLAGGLVLASTLLVTTAAGAQRSAAAAPAGFSLPSLPLAGSRTPPRWPSIAEQLAKDRVLPGSALEKLILANQDFSLLRPDEAADRNPVPPWLRVLWRKAHPNGRYSAADPTGGYPLLLREIHEWLLTHQDLVRGRRSPASAETATPTAAKEQRISGAAPVPRSESAIRVNPFDPSKIIAASNNIGGSGEQAIFYSTDGGATWGQSSLPLLPNDYFESDPTVDWTSDGTAWSTTIGVTQYLQLQVRAFKSTDDGVTWSYDATVSGSQSEADKEMLWADHSASSPYKDNLYAIWHDQWWALIARRTGPAGRWQNPVLVSGEETTGTPIGGDVTTNSAGDVFGFWPDTTSQSIFVVKSTDGGLNFSPARRVGGTFGSFQIGVPANDLRGALIYVSAAAWRTSTRNDVYVTWNDLSGESGCAAFFLSPYADTSNPCKSRIWFSRSTDGGATWSPPSKVYDPATRNDQFFPWLSLDETSGRLSIVYYDTIKDLGRLQTELYYQSSDDDGATWNLPFQVTSAPTDETAAGADANNQYGDYISLSGVGGLLFPSWTDRRSGGREEIWSAAVTDPGSCASSAAITLTATPKNTAGVELGWSQVAGATYQVYRAAASGGPYALIAGTASSSFFDPAGPCDATSYYAVRAQAGCSSALSNEVAFTNRPSVVLYSNSFDSGHGGLSDWAVGTMVDFGPATDWFGEQTCRAHSGQWSFRFGSPSCQGGAGMDDFLSAQPGGASGIPVPAGATLTQLSFWHDYEFRLGAGGGSLAFSVAPGNNYLVVPQTLSGTTYGVGSIGSLCAPVVGAPAFTGSSGGFVNTLVDLDSNCTIAGAPGCGGVNLAIGFLGITDCSSPPQTGWFLDDVVVSTCPAVPRPALGFYTLPPCRLIDTRQPAAANGGPALAPQSTRSFVAAGSCGVPPWARSISANVTVANAAAAGSLNLFASDQIPPGTSVISFAAGQVRANNAIIALASGSGAVSAANSSPGTVDLIIDVNGYFQ